jgi:AcrR family transcriptional regulator
MPTTQPAPAPVHGVDAAPITTPEVEQILDAALLLYTDVGIRRSTVGDVARRAGVDRVTVYRRVGNKDEILQAVALREATRLTEAVLTAAAGHDTLADRIATAFATAVVHLRQNPILNRILALEPETALARLTTDASSVLTASVAAATYLFDQAVADGLLQDTDDKVATAEIFVRLVHSCLLTPQAVLPLETYDDLAAFARNHLVPIVSRGQGG